MRRWLGFLTAAFLMVGTVNAGNGEMFLTVYGGYSYNDSSLEREYDTVDGRSSIPYGIVWGGETPVAGGSIGLQINRVGEVKMDTLMFSVIMNFASHDTRKGIGKVIYNRASGYIVVGIGMMRYEDRFDADYPLAAQLGIGTQFKFSRVIGMRVELTGIGVAKKSLINTQATLGLSFYW